MCWHCILLGKNNVALPSDGTSLDFLSHLWCVYIYIFVGNHILFNSLISLCFQRMMFPSSFVKQKDDEMIVFLIQRIGGPTTNQLPISDYL
jgi:hypothetical protein